jgi:16S rRNA (cytidine1402-2'-O)-methyltransferase
VCRELTKTYEEVRRGGLGELAGWARGDVRGEITLVVAGAPATADDVNPAELAAEVAAREDAGQVRKDAIADVARLRGLPKRVVFDAVVAAKGN